LSHKQTFSPEKSSPTLSYFYHFVWKKYASGARGLRRVSVKLPTTGHCFEKIKIAQNE